MSVIVGGTPMSFDDWLKKNQDVLNINGNDLGLGGQNQPQGPQGNFDNPATTIFDITEENYKAPESTLTQTSGSGAASFNNPMSMTGSIFTLPNQPVDGAFSPPGVDAVPTVVTSALTAPPKNDGTGAQGGSTSGNSGQTNLNYFYSQYQEEIKDLQNNNNTGAGMMTLDLNLSINPDGTPVDKTGGDTTPPEGSNAPPAGGETPPSDVPPEDKPPEGDVGEVPKETPEEKPVNKEETSADIDRQRENEDEQRRVRRTEEEKAA